MSSSFGLFGVESHDFSHAEEERTACEANNSSWIKKEVLRGPAHTIVMR